MPPSDPSPRARCVYEKSLALVPGSSRLTVVDDGGIGFYQPTVGGPLLVSASGTARSHDSGASGFAVYEGDAVLSPREGLAKLGEPRLIDRYDRDVERFSSGRYHRWARPAWITIMVGGMAAIGTGLGVMLSAHPDPRTGVTDFGPTIPLLAGGAGGLLLSIPFLSFDLLNRDEEGQLAARDALLVGDEPYLQAVKDAVERHNQRVAAGCAP